MTICWCHFITDIIVYTIWYAEFGRNCLKNKLNITHCSECCVGSLLQCRWPWCFVSDSLDMHMRQLVVLWQSIIGVYKFVDIYSYTVLILWIWCINSWQVSLCWLLCESSISCAFYVYKFYVKMTPYELLFRNSRPNRFSV